MPTWRRCVFVLRDRLGAIIWSIVSEVPHAEVAEVDLIYAPAAFRRPRRVDLQPSVRASLIDHFEGWSADPSLPTRAIVGLGYEPGRAVGAIEFLEPSLIDFFIPKGFDPRYEECVRRSNDGLLASSDAVSSFAYTLREPHRLMTRLLSVVEGGARAGYRPLLLPLGPKIYAAGAFVASALAEERVPVLARFG